MKPNALSSSAGFTRRALEVGAFVAASNTLAAAGRRHAYWSPGLQQESLPSGNRMDYSYFEGSAEGSSGGGDSGIDDEHASSHDIIFIHGLLGRSRVIREMRAQCEELGLNVLAPEICGTDWWKRRTVRQIGQDIAALARKVFGEYSRPGILCVSGGAKEGILTCTAHENASFLCIASGQSDFARGAFGLLNHEPKKQKHLNAIWGVPKQAIFPHAQSFRNRLARGKQRIAYNHVERVVQRGGAASHLLAESWALPDQRYLKSRPEFKRDLYEDASSHSAEEVIYSLNMLRGWDDGDIDFSNFPYTEIHHGREDRIVPQGNARILKDMFTRGGHNNVHIEPHKGYGHLLLVEKLEYFAGRMKEIMVRG